MIKNRNCLFEEWWANYSHCFASHATTHLEVLSDKTLKCAEDVLRERGQVEHEALSTGYRRISKISDLLHPGNAWHGFAYEENIEGEGAAYNIHYIIPDFAYDSDYLQKLKLWRAKKNDYAIEDKGAYIKFSFSTRGLLTYSEYDSDFSREEYIGVKHTQITKMRVVKASPPQGDAWKKDIYFDNLPDVDRTMRAIYQGCVAENICPDRLAYSMYMMRLNLVNDNQNRLAFDIRVEKNGVRWH